MKNIRLIFITILISALFPVNVLATTDKYIEIMKKNIQKLYEADSVEELRQTVNALERIGKTEKTKWEPFYYASLGYVFMATKEKDPAKMDTYLDMATTQLDEVKKLQVPDSEILTIEGFIFMMRIMVDPPSRGQQYSMRAHQSYTKALENNPDNPRALVMLAQLQYGTAQFFNAPATEACATLRKAFEKFDSYKSESPLAPQWGRKSGEELQSKCN